MNDDYNKYIFAVCALALLALVLLAIFAPETLK